jgi:hypothetical protein
VPAFCLHQPAMFNGGAQRPWYPRSSSIVNFFEHHFSEILYSLILDWTPAKQWWPLLGWSVSCWFFRAVKQLDQANDKIPYTQVTPAAMTRLMGYV